jgi:oxygen-dependent protoporphyrinogen oxidase
MILSRLLGMSARVIVVGAGTAGLTAAWALSRAGVEVTVLERDDRVGGRVLTADVEGTPVEFGASFLTNFYPKTLRIAHDLGLTDGAKPAQTLGAVPRGGRLHGVSALRPFRNSLIPVGSKLRLLKTAWTVVRHWRCLDHEAMWRADRLDTRSVAAYAAADLDAHILDYIFEPSLRAFLYWEPEQTTQAMLFIMLKQAVGMRRVPVPGGRISALPEALARTVEVRLGAKVREVRPRPEGGYTVVAVIDGLEHRLTADGVVCGTTATQVPLLLPELSDEQREFFGAIRYSATVCVAIPTRGRVLRPYTGVLTPRRETRDLAAATCRSADGARPDSARDVLVLYASSDGARRLSTSDAPEIADALLADLRTAVPGFDAELELASAAVQRWPEALPIFDVGHLRALRHFAEGRYEIGSLVFAGDYLGGPFVEGAVNSGLDAAQRLLARLTATIGKG